MSSRSSGSRVDARTYAPSPDLAHVVAALWMSRWDLRGQAPHVVELLSDPSVNVAFEAGRGRVVGVHTRLWRRELAGASLVRAVKLRPGAARAVLGAPAHLFTDRSTPAGPVLGRGVRSAALAILEPARDEVGLEALQDFLRARVPAALDAKASLAVALVEEVASKPELTSVARLAKRAGLSPRPLERLFRDEVGASPKWVIRRARLQEAALALERGDSGSIAELAARLGYADHAHLTRDFKAATGKPPSAFVRGVV